MRIAIDFGTCFSLGASLINGKPERLLRAGEYAVPSVFYYDKRSGVIVGEEAENRAKYRPQNLVRDVKMEISNPAVKTFRLDSRTFSKKQIVGSILSEVKRIAKKEIARKQLTAKRITGAVISVPAAFTLRELNLIREAAQEEAKLKVIGFIREPVAAAITYFNAPAAEDKKTILVYDLGGGTCDVAIVRADKNAREWYTVIDSDMLRIGGRDWDKILAELIKRKCREQSLFIEFDERAEHKILTMANEVKHTLSQLKKWGGDLEIGDELYDIEITRKEFERATSELLQDTMRMVDKLISKCATKIDYIVCVGGSSNMPQVKEAFKKNYPHIPIKLYEPESAIAFGAAIYAEHVKEENFLKDICKFSYGARYVQNFSKYRDYDRLRIFNIIYKGDPLPASGESTSTHIDDGTNTYIAIYESECMDYVYLPENGKKIGAIRIRGLEDSKKGDETILTVNIDRSGLMELKAVDKRTGKTVEAEIQLDDY